MSNIVFTCSFNRMCNSYYWCSTCAAREFFFLGKNLVRIIMSALTHTNNAHCEHGKKYCCHRLRYACVHFHFYHHYLGSHSYCHKVESDSKMLFFHYYFYSHFEIRTLLFTIYIEIIHRILKFMHELLSVCSLLSFSLIHQCDESCSSHRSESIPFDSIRFNSIQFEFIFKFVILFSMELNKNYSNSSSSIFSFCLLSPNERKHTVLAYIANGIIYSFAALCKMNLKICQTATGSGYTSLAQILWQSSTFFMRWHNSIKIVFLMLPMLYLCDFCRKLNCGLMQSI